MIDRSDQVWMYERNDSWVVAVVLCTRARDRDGSVLHECVQLAGDDVHFSQVGCVIWLEYDDDEPWEEDACFMRLV